MFNVLIVPNEPDQAQPSADVVKSLAYPQTHKKGTPN